MRGLQFRVAGFPVRVEPMFFVIMGMLGLASGRGGVLIVEWLVVAGASILVHELGHAVAFRWFGAEPEIVLHGFGGVTIGTAQPPRRSMVVSLAGPFTGFAAGLLAVAASNAVTTESELVRAALSDLVFVNVAWGVFNLLPILPLDGGSVMASVLAQATGGGGRRAAHVLSVVGAVAVGIGGLVLRQPLIAMMAAFFGHQNYQAVAAERDGPLFERIGQGRALLLAGDHAEAAAIAEAVVSRPTSARVETAAAELAAWAHLAAGRPTDAEAALDRLGGGVTASALVRAMVELAAGRTVRSLAPGFGTCDDLVAATVAAGVVSGAGRLDQVVDELSALQPDQAVNGLRALQLGLHHAGRFGEAARVGAILFGRQPDALVAYNTAASSARAGSADDTLTWLTRAVDLGYRDTAALDGDPSFDLIRATDGFRALRAWIEADPAAEEPDQGTGTMG